MIEDEPVNNTIIRKKLDVNTAEVYSLIESNNMPDTELEHLKYLLSYYQHY